MNSYLKKFAKNTSTEQTHLSFIGGKYNIDNKKDHDQFYKNYYNDLIRSSKNEKMFLIEKVPLPNTSVFNYYQDIDFPNEREHEQCDNDNDNDSKIEEIIDATIKQFKEVRDCSTPSVKELVIEPVVTKRNNMRYHIHYVNLVVDARTATKLTEQIKTETGYPIDTTVYRTGLRLIGSFKSKEEQETYKIYDMKTKTSIEFDDPKFTFELFKKVCIRTEVATNQIRSGPAELEVTVTATATAPTKLNDEIQKLLEEKKEELGLEFEMNDYSIKQTTNKAGVPSIYVTPTQKQICPFKGECHARKTNPVYIQLNKANNICVRCFDERCITKKFPEFGLPIQFNKYPELSRILTGPGPEMTDHDTSINQILTSSLTGTHFNIAKALHSIYKSRFMVDDVKNSDWYEFDEIRGKWNRSYSINIVVSQDFPHYYRNLKISSEGTGDTNGPFNEHIDRLINKLESSTFKTSVINEAKFLFHQDNPKFAEKLDTNPYLIGFENGVYDLREARFRNGKPDDYVTFSTGYNYVPYDSSDPQTQQIYEFFGKILTNDRVREYTLGILGKSLVGFPDEKFYIWTGLSGANGKSTLVNFLEMTLGDYANSQDVALLTNKRAASNAATPEVIDIKGRRMVFFQEPEPTDRLKTGILKQFTGGDTIRARELYKKPISFKSSAKFFMCCNDLPHVSSCDAGTWRRIRVTEFKSRFCDEPKKANEFLIDPDLKWKLDIWRPYFMSILIHYYHKYNGVKLQEPSEVSVATARYKTDNDKYNDFFEECLDELTDKNGVSAESSFTSTIELFSAFEYWWKANYLNEKLPPKSEFKTALRNKYGEELTRFDSVLRKRFKGFPVVIRDDHHDHTDI